jgi:small-conductance mechanosensitive channel
MPKQPLGRPWRVALAVIALMSLAMAFYVQLFERRSLREEDRLEAARLEHALEASRVRLKAEILAQLQADLAKGESTGEAGDQPLPSAVLRRSESGADRSLRQVLDSQESQDAVLARLRGSVDELTRQMEESDRALRRDLEEVRAEDRRERDVSGKTLGLLLVALVPLVVHLLATLWPPGD